MFQEIFLGIAASVSLSFLTYLLQGTTVSTTSDPVTRASELVNPGEGKGSEYVDERREKVLQY